MKLLLCLLLSGCVVKERVRVEYRQLPPVRTIVQPVIMFLPSVPSGPEKPKGDTDREIAHEKNRISPQETPQAHTPPQMLTESAPAA